MSYVLNEGCSEEHDDDFKDSKGYTVLMIVLIIFLVSLAVYGYFMRAQSIGRCTEATIATVSYENVQSYLYAPYHGGEIQTRYRTYVDYSFDVDGNTYTINCVFPYAANGYPSVVDVIYNPGNPDEFWYNCAIINNFDSNDIDWCRRVIY